MASASISLVLIDDHTLVRTGFRSLLESAGMKVLGEAGDAMEATTLVAELSPDVVLMDVAMPKLGGIEGVRQIIASRPSTRVLMLSMHSDEQYVFESLRAGAAGYVLKGAAFSELTEAIKTVAAGRTYLAPGLSEVVTKDYIRRARGENEPSGLEKLSDRERQVLQLVAGGHTSAEIASLLHISIRTVDTHRTHVMDKLGVRNIAELVKFAIRHGLCTI